ncbi:unnamed protein product [Ceratitis capitata]|uniref:(Mediterranean fruit fly) hypothetical protein n=1 Tax=Ceratitis capitata TaxID=7213 RepID=A0A811UEB9_CERCA|nr:unnamed protein product [Ceratitis capitata]
MTSSTDNSTMASLALPPELYWDCKPEPVSPMSAELFTMTEPAGFWLNDDNIESEIVMVTDEDFELKPGMELLNGDNLVLEFCDLKEGKQLHKYFKLFLKKKIVCNFFSCSYKFYIYTYIHKMRSVFGIVCVAFVLKKSFLWIVVNFL